MSEKQFTALVYRVCPFCGKKDEDQSEILIHKRFGDVSKLHNQAVGFGKFCKQCKPLLEQGIGVVIVDERKTDDMNNPHRTGQIAVVTREAIERMGLDEETLKGVLSKGMTYMDIRVADHTGLLDMINEANSKQG